MTSEVYTVKDIQEILKIGKNTAYQIIESRQFKVIRIGKTYRIPKEAFHKWLNNVES